MWSVIFYCSLIWSQHCSWSEIMTSSYFFVQRISETLDGEIKLWATGKEGNLRALISSLHLVSSLLNKTVKQVFFLVVSLRLATLWQVLWPGCGWEAVSLTDFTYASVKKVYKKANLYVHPDKVHQKGAQQKYIAEKVFNILQVIFSVNMHPLKLIAI